MKNHVIRISFTSLFTFYFATIFGQSEISRIDKFAIATQARTLDSLHYKLTYKFGSDEEKVRAIFRWITFNISYDLIGVNKKNIYSEIHKKLENVDSSTYEEKYNQLDAEKVFKERRAVCDGYSRLFKYLCDLSQIKAVIINGYSRTLSNEIGITGDVNHSWNAVLLNKKWNLLDVTWASGYCNSARTKFYKEFCNLYYLTPSHVFITNHLPEESKWTLLKEGISKKSFFSAPYLTDDFFNMGVKDYFPKSGVIQIDSTERIDIDLDFENTTDSSLVIIESYIDPKTKIYKSNFRYLPSRETLEEKLKAEYLFENKKICLKYRIQKKTTTKIEVLYKGKIIMVYRIDR